LTNNKKFLFIVFFTALILSYYQTIRIDAPNYELKLKRYNEIISNTAGHPYKYRLLNPYIVSVTFSVFKSALSEKPAFLLAYFFQNILVYVFLLFSLSKLLSIWFDNSGIIIGALLFSVIVLLCLTGWDTLGDLTTAAFMALGFYFINARKINYIYLVLIIGAFNELQIILLILFWFLGEKANLYSPKVWLKFVSFVLTFLIIYALIFAVRGSNPQSDLNIWTERKDMLFNIHNPGFIILWALTIIPLLIFALKNIKTKPEFLKRNLFSVIPAFYVITFFVIARMNEIDKALTIFIILIPLALYTLLPGHIKPAGNSVRESGAQN
jgi:hypothetical protein